MAIPDIIPGEIEGIFKAIVSKASVLKNHNVHLSHEELASYMVGDKDWMNNPIEENIKRRKNRIRHKLNDELVRMGITPKWKGIEDGYDFTIDSSIPIDIKQKESKEEYKGNVKCQTFTPYSNNFIAPPHFQYLLKSLRMGLNPIQVGPKGCGKSRCFEEAGALLGIPQIRITLGSVHDPADLIGVKDVFNESGVSVTKFVPGIITEAIQNGTMVILDELDCVHPEVATSLNMLLEGNTKVSVMTERGVVVIDRHPNTRIVATANTWGYGEGGMLYAGTNIGNRATWDRFAPSIEVDYDCDIEKTIISEWLHPNVVKMLYQKPNKDVKEGIVLVIRDAIKKREILDHLSFRSIERFAKHYNEFGWHLGMEIFIINTINPAYRDAIRNKIRLSFGDEFIPSSNMHNSKGENYIPELKEKILKMGTIYEGVV